MNIQNIMIPQRYALYIMTSLYHSTTLQIQKIVVVKPIIGHWMEREITHSTRWDRSDDPQHLERILYHSMSRSMAVIGRIERCFIQQDNIFIKQCRINPKKERKKCFIQLSGRAFAYDSVGRRIDPIWQTHLSISCSSQ